MVHTIFQVATFIHKIISDFVASLIDKPRLNKVWIKMSHFTLADRPGSVNDFFQAMNKQILKAVFLPIQHKQEKLNSRHNSYQTLITTSGACFILCIAWSIEEDFWRKQRPRENKAKEERKQENILENLFEAFFVEYLRAKPKSARKKSRNRGKIFTATIGARSENANDLYWYSHCVKSWFNYWNAVVCKRLLGENAQKDHN